MKKILGFIAMSFLALNVMASGKGAPSSDGYGTPRCAAYDAGSKEEHSPHNSCESCISSGHDNCDMKCFSYDYTCTAKTQVEEYTQVIGADGRAHQERRLVDREFTARGNTRDQARQNALWECDRGARYAGARGYCQSSSCSENSYETSNRSCRR